MNKNTNNVTNTDADTLAELNALRNENAKLAAKLAGVKLAGGIKISAKGGVSVYGLGRWPVTLYASQWDNLLSRVDAIKDFIAENADKLAKKATDEAAAE